MPLEPSSPAQPTGGAVRQAVNRFNINAHREGQPIEYASLSRGRQAELRIVAGLQRVSHCPIWEPHHDRLSMAAVQQSCDGRLNVHHIASSKQAASSPVRQLPENK